MGKRKSGSEYKKMHGKVMKALVASNYDFASVAKKFDLSTLTVKKWWAKYRNTGEHTAEVAIIQASTAITIEKMRADFAQQNFDLMNNVMQAALHRTYELLETESDLARVSMAVKAVTELYKSLTASQPEGRQEGSQMKEINLIQQTIYQLNNNK